MTMQTKTFDCVRMKNAIQAKRLAEYRERQREFSSYLDFVNARVRQSELLQVVRSKAAPRASSEGNLK